MPGELSPLIESFIILLLALIIVFLAAVVLALPGSSTLLFLHKTGRLRPAYFCLNMVFMEPLLGLSYLSEIVTLQLA